MGKHVCLRMINSNPVENCISKLTIKSFSTESNNLPIFCTSTKIPEFRFYGSHSKNIKLELDYIPDFWKTTAKICTNISHVNFFFKHHIMLLTALLQAASCDEHFVGKKLDSGEEHFRIRLKPPSPRLTQNSPCLFHICSTVQHKK